MDAWKKPLRSALWATALSLCIGAAAPAAQPLLRAAHVQGTGPIVDPDAALWNRLPAVTVPMQPQIVATPTNPHPAIRELKVEAVHNGQWLALLIEWKDSTKSNRIVEDRFGDQVAVELPVKYNPKAPPSPMMGNPGGRVTILQWRAAFQHDVDHGPPRVHDLYPYAQVDVYPDQVLRATDARPYMGAVGVDNPISQPERTPVLDQMAEGWGTLTVKLNQNADGKGVWNNGAWRVVITHPLASGDQNDPNLTPGARTLAAFAVWDGGHREVGSRKSWSTWVPLILDK